MPTVTIDEKGCRDCMLCIDICPVDVFEHDDSRGVPKVAHESDCIGCTSCAYICPSRCMTVSDSILQRPFHRLEGNRAFIAKFLQHDDITASVTPADLDEAIKDVSTRLQALGDSVTETMGRGQRAVGRKAGSLAASHMPEMYEEVGMADVVKRLQRRFADSFDFDVDIAQDGSEVKLTFKKCALAGVVQKTGGTVGKAMLCGLFHEYWAGLLGEFTNARYNVEVEPGTQCKMRLTARD